MSAEDIGQCARCRRTQHVWPAWETTIPGKHCAGCWDAITDEEALRQLQGKEPRMWIPDLLRG